MIQRLDADTLSLLYEESMKATFPRRELKPLSAMLRMQSEGCYDVWGYYSKHDELLAYACICNVANPVLLDYLAVVEAHRGEGLGSLFLQELMQENTLYPAIMLEIEAVGAASNSDDRRQRERRLKFYERLGFSQTLTEAKIFGEHYWVLDSLATQERHDVNEALEKVYHYMVRSPEVYSQFVHISSIDS